MIYRDHGLDDDDIAVIEGVWRTNKRQKVKTMGILRSLMSFFTSAGQICGSLIAVVGTLGFLWFLEGEDRKKEKERVELIESQRGQWGDQYCDRLIQKKVANGMTEEMVKAGLGDRYEVDQEESLASGRLRYRWVYGSKWSNARYIWFEEGRVIKYKI